MKLITKQRTIMNSLTMVQQVDEVEFAKCSQSVEKFFVVQGFILNE